MSFIADLARLGILPMQHHLPPGQTCEDNKTVVHGVRIFDRDTVRGNHKLKVDKKLNTYGPLHGGAVWVPAYKSPYASFPTRNVALWSQCFPARVDLASKNPECDDYQTKVTSEYVAVPAFQQDQGAEGWNDDVSVTPQKITTPIGMKDVPGDMPGIALPTSTVFEQQMAFVPSGNMLVAVHRGGEGKFGSFVYDVDPNTKKLDRTRRARIHSFFRVYKLPKGGPVNFGGTDPKNPGGLAWQLAYDVDGNAGLGVVCDLGTAAQKIGDQPSKTATTSGTNINAGAGLGPGNASGTASGAPPAVGSGVPPSLGQPVNLGAGANPITLATTVAGLQKQLDQVDQSIQAAAAAGPAGASALATLTDQRHQIENALAKAYAASQGGGTTAKPGGGKVQVFAAASQSVFGMFHVGDAGDPHQIASGDDGPVNCLHFNVNAPWKGDGFDAPVKSGQPWVQPTSNGPLVAETLFCIDPGDTHPFVNGNRPGLRKWRTPIPFDHPPPTIIDGGGGMTTGPDEGGSQTTPVDPTGTGTGTTINDEKPPTSIVPGGPGGSATTGGRTSTTGGGTSNTTGGKTSGGNTIPGIPDSGGLTTPGGYTPTTPGGPTIPGLPPVAPGFTGLLLDGGGSPTGVNPIPLPFNALPSLGVTNATTSKLDGRITALDRTYTRTPHELAVPALLARPVQLNSFGYDWRNQQGPLTGSAFKAYDSAPIAGKLEAFADQSGGGYQYQGSRTKALYRKGVSSRGGFALTPANVDLQDVIHGRPIPGSLSATHLMLATTGTSFSHADPNRAGQPTNGFVHNRGSKSANGSWPFTIKGVLSDGSVANTSIWSYGTDASGTDQTGTNTTHTPSRGTGTGSGGEFQVAIGVVGSTGTTVHGATTRFRVTNNGLRFQNSDLSTMFQLDNTSGPANIAFFGVTPVAQQTTFGAITNSTGGSPSTTYAAVPAAYSQADQQTRWASVADQIGKLRAALVAYGLSS